MVRKKVDDRLRTLMENCVKTNHRSLIVLVGDGGKDQVVNLHYMLSKTQVKARPSVLWCYKKELGFSTHKKKRMRQIKKMKQRGLYDPNKDDPFELFVASTNIRWAYYKDSHRVLGQTYGMCVLQDFEGVTPNLLARTVETVEGGGTIVLLLRKLDSLKQFYSMTMDVHSRFRTTSHDVVKPRFNERFMLSLGTCKTCIVMDDELNVLPISKHARNIKPIEATDEEKAEEKNKKKLRELKETLAEAQPAGSLVALAKTFDQAKAVMNFIEAVSEKTLKSTVTLTAARGRGKSAALGIAIASAVAFGYSNIFVTSPTPENLTTVFEFVFKGLDAIQYKEHMDYEIIQSTNPDFNNAVVRVNIFHEHRQTIQYIDPADHEKLAQAELVVIDEAAAIPLPLVKKLIGPYLVFMSSTINGYEGTGRSLSLKLIDQLRKRASESDNQAGSWRTNEYMYKRSAKKAGKMEVEGASNGKVGGRQLREIELEEPIRYGSDDPVENWLHHTLCLDATKIKQRIVNGTPHPSKCELYAVDRDTLFSHHKVSEAFLQRVMSLFVSSHYKNSPNDLQLLSDAPAHRLFVLLGPQDDGSEGIPDILCVVQVSLEGGIAQHIVKSQLQQGNRASGDLVPWMVSQQYQVNDFAKLNGARVVRIATHPDVTSMGYGKRAIELLQKFYQGDLFDVHVDNDNDNDDNNDNDDAFEGLPPAAVSGGDAKVSLQTEKIKPRKSPRPLLVPVSQMRPQRLHYVSVSFGITEPLYRFWAKGRFVPFYIRQTPNELTGEHSCVMISPLNCDDMDDAPERHWELSFLRDFRRRFTTLLAGPFRGLSATLGLTILRSALGSESAWVDARDDENGESSSAAKHSSSAAKAKAKLSSAELDRLFLSHDLKRLDAYARNLVDYHLVADLLPRIATVFFDNRLANVSLSALQSALLVGLGLQTKTIDMLVHEYDMSSSQLLALFNRSIRKLSKALAQVQESGVAMEMEDTQEMKKARALQKKLKSGQVSLRPLTSSLDAEQKRAGEEAMEELRAKQKKLLDTIDISQYAIEADNEQEWEKALENGNKINMVSIKSGKRKKDQSASSASMDNAKAKETERKKKKRSGKASSELQKAKFAERKGKHKRNPSRNH